MVPTSSALDLLSGDAQTFREKVWASHVHLHHTDPEQLVGLLSLDDVDHLLTEVALRAPALRLAKDGAVLPESRFTRSATMAGRAEAIWFPFTDAPWLKVWSVSEQRPAGSRFDCSRRRRALSPSESGTGSSFSNRSHRKP